MKKLQIQHIDRPLTPDCLTTSFSDIFGLWGEGLVWLIGAVVCLHAAPRVQLFASMGNGWPHNALRYH